MSDFEKYIGNKYDPNILEKTLAEIAENISKQTNEVLPRMVFKQEEQLEEFHGALKEEYDLSARYAEAQCKLNKQTMKNSELEAQIKDALDVSKRKTEEISALEEALQMNKAKMDHLTQNHLEFMKKLGEQFREAHNLYDNEKLKAEVAALEEEVDQLYTVKESKKIETERMREEMERGLENADPDNLKAVMDRLPNLQFMIQYMQQADKDLDDMIAKLEGLDNKKV